MSDIVPPYLQRRVRVALIFARYMDEAADHQNSPLLAELEALRAEILAALDAVDKPP